MGQASFECHSACALLEATHRLARTYSASGMFIFSIAPSSGNKTLWMTETPRKAHSAAHETRSELLT